jgi:hypothetical protein
MVQELPAAREVPQFPGIRVKPLPVTVALLGVTGTVPVFVRVKVSGAASVFDSPTVAVPKLKLAGVRVAAGVGAATPVPVSVLVLVPAFVTMLMEPVADPTAVGWKVIAMVQELAAARDVPQFPGISAKPLPATVMVPGVTDTVPVLVSVNVSGEGSVFDSPTVALPKLKLPGVRVAVGVAAADPLPVKLLVLVPALVMMLIDPVTAPTAVGWKLTEMVQELPAASDVPQFPGISAKPLPVTVTLPTVTAAAPVLDNVNVSGAG